MRCRQSEYSASSSLAHAVDRAAVLSAEQCASSRADMSSSASGRRPSVAPLRRTDDRLLCGDAPWPMSRTACRRSDALVGTPSRVSPGQMRTAARPFQSVETNANTQTLNHILPRGLPSPVGLVVVPAALLTAAVVVTTAVVSLRTLRRRGTAEATLQRLGCVRKQPRGRTRRS